MFGKISAAALKRGYCRSFRLPGSVHEAWVGAEQLRNKPAQLHEASAPFREAHPAIGRDNDVPYSRCSSIRRSTAPISIT